MQAHIDVDRDGILVFASRRGNRRIYHRDDGQFEFGCNAKKQAKVIGAHSRRHDNDDLVIRRCQRSPHLLELAACQICSTQMSEALVCKRRGYKLRPVVMLDSSRLYACGCICLVARRQLIVIEERETGLPVQDSPGVEYHNSSIVYVCGYNTQASDPLKLDPTSYGESTWCRNNFRYRIPGVPATVATDAQET